MADDDIVMSQNSGGFEGLDQLDKIPDAHIPLDFELRDSRTDLERDFTLRLTKSEHEPNQDDIENQLNCLLGEIKE